MVSPHATVLVTPLRIKTEANSLPTSCIGNAMSSPNTNAITSISDFNRKSAMQTNSTLVTIDTNANSNNCSASHSNHLSNICAVNTNGHIHNHTNCNNNGSSNNGIVHKNMVSPQKMQIVHTSASMTHTTTTPPPPSPAAHHMSITRNAFGLGNDGGPMKSQTSPPISKNFMFPVNLHAAITNPNPNRIKRERSPIHMNSQPQSLPQLSSSQQQSQHTQTSSASHVSTANASITTVTPVTSSGQMLHPSIQLQHPVRDGAILFRVKNDAQQMPCLIQTNNPNRIMWNSNTRINGVKPEIIGGPIPLRSPATNVVHTSVSSTNSSQQPPRNTPTVIMGESCGVRTMVRIGKFVF